MLGGGGGGGDGVGGGGGGGEMSGKRRRLDPLSLRYHRHQPHHHQHHHHHYHNRHPNCQDWADCMGLIQGHTVRVYLTRVVCVWRVCEMEGMHAWVHIIVCVHVCVSVCVSVCVLSWDFSDSDSLINLMQASDIRAQL